MFLQFMFDYLRYTLYMSMKSAAPWRSGNNKYSATNCKWTSVCTGQMHRKCVTLNLPGGISILNVASQKWTVTSVCYTS